MSVLVTGGAGFIGSHMVLTLLENDENVVVLDNLTTGFRANVAEGAKFIEGDIRDPELVCQILEEHEVDAIIHFAGSIIVPESVDNPLMYYSNNTAASRDLIEICVKMGVKNFIFSSTAAVYGISGTDPLSEIASKAPESPYGRSKLMTEWMLEDTSRASDLRYVALRYFNVAGADPKGRTGQSSPRATHLIKRASQAALGRIDFIGIFGTDYPTPDGTGVRDYIHVTDLVAAHALSLRYLRDGGESAIFNCGYGYGFSVRQVIEAVERVSGTKLPISELPRRAGDPPAVVSDPSKIKATLKWQPNHASLDEIVQSALSWEKKLTS